MPCKYHSNPAVSTEIPLTNEYLRIDNDDALKAKVDEAMGVYQEYVKAQGGEGAEGAEAPKEEAKAEEKA